MKYIGIDLGGTNIVSAVVQKQQDNYKILSKKSCKTNVPRDTREICNDMIRISVEALKECNSSLDEVKYIGVGIPGSVDPEEGKVNFATNLFAENWYIVDMLKEILNDSEYLKTLGTDKTYSDIEILIENDANAAAYGEFLAGAAKDATNSVMITLGTGIGGGIIINKKIYSARNYAAGELGHIVIVKDGIKCNCGRNGCWEKYASATGLINITCEEMKRNKNSKMWEYSESLDKVNGMTSFECAKAGDESALKVVEEYIDYLACGAASVINIFQPDCLVVGGGISNQGEYLLEPLRKKLAKETYSKNLKYTTDIIKAQLGNDAGLLGAALLAI